MKKETSMTDQFDEPVGEGIPRPQLRVWATVGEAYGIWFANLGLWLKLSIVPVLILIVFKAIAPSLLPDASAVNTGAIGTSVGVFFVLGMVLYLSEIPLATAWHRFVLTYEDTTSHRYLIGGREWRYFLKALLIAVIVLAVSLAIGLVLGIVMVPVMMAGASGSPAMSIQMMTLMTTPVVLLFYAAIGYFLGHLFLMLPAAAIGRKLRARETRAAVRSNEWRLVGVYIVALLPIWLVGTLLTWPFGGANTAILKGTSNNALLPED
jgi:hypothetical protein